MEAHARVVMVGRATVMNVGDGQKMRKEQRKQVREADEAGADGLF